MNYDRLIAEATDISMDVYVTNTRIGARKSVFGFPDEPIAGASYGDDMLSPYMYPVYRSRIPYRKRKHRLDKKWRKKHRSYAIYAYSPLFRMDRMLTDEEFDRLYRLTKEMTYELR